MTAILVTYEDDEEAPAGLGRLMAEGIDVRRVDSEAAIESAAHHRCSHGEGRGSFVARTKRKKTLADYVVIAISPVLIMTLVGSLAFFLLELSYHGQYELRLKWILFWFVLAAVLVARIAIEQGKEHASLFGIALIVVVGLAAIRLVDEFLVAWVLCAVCWWCTWKLTWDCTLIDDNEDASGEGLLQAAGFDGGAGTPAKPLPPAAPAALTAGVNAPRQPTATWRSIGSRAIGAFTHRANGSSIFRWRPCLSSARASC